MRKRRTNKKVNTVKVKLTPTSIEITEEDTIELYPGSASKDYTAAAKPMSTNGSVLYITESEVNNLIGWYTQAEVAEFLRSKSKQLPILRNTPYRMSDSLSIKGRKSKLYHTKDIIKAIEPYIRKDSEIEGYAYYKPTILTNA